MATHLQERSFCPPHSVSHFPWPKQSGSFLPNRSAEASIRSHGARPPQRVAGGSRKCTSHGSRPDLLREPLKPLAEVARRRLPPQPLTSRRQQFEQRRRQRARTGRRLLSQTILQHHLASAVRHSGRQLQASQGVRCACRRKAVCALSSPLIPLARSVEHLPVYTGIWPFLSSFRSGMVFRYAKVVWQH